MLRLKPHTTEGNNFVEFSCSDPFKRHRQRCAVASEVQEIAEHLRKEWDVEYVWTHLPDPMSANGYYTFEDHSSKWKTRLEREAWFMLRDVQIFDEKLEKAKRDEEA